MKRTYSPVPPRRNRPMAALLVVLPILLTLVFSLKCVRQLRASYIDELLNQTAYAHKASFKQTFLDLELTLGCLAESVAPNTLPSRAALRKLVVDVQRRYHLSDVMIIAPNDIVIETADSPEALEQPLSGPLFEKTSLLATVTRARTEGRSITDFDPSVSTSTGFLAVSRANSAESMVLVAEYGKDTVNAMLKRLSKPGYMSMAVLGEDGGKRGETHGFPASVQEIDQLSSALEMEGLGWTILAVADSTADADLGAIKKGILAMICVLVILAVLLFRSVSRGARSLDDGSRIPARVSQEHLKDITIAASALPPERRLEVVNHIRGLLRQSVWTAGGEPDDPKPVEPEK